MRVGCATILLASAVMILHAGTAVVASAQTPRQVKVTVQFSRTGAQSREGVDGGGSVIITERGAPRARGRAGVESTQTTVRQSTGVFTLVQDGGESTLTVATQVPYTQAQFYRDYATGRGYLTSTVVFRDVGTSLKVRAIVLPDEHIRLRLTPSISWLADDGSGAIEFTEAATELVVRSGQPVVLGGSTTETHAVTRQILGIGARDAASETSVVLTATTLGR